jgi:hypothetical protein
MLGRSAPIAARSATAASGLTMVSFNPAYALRHEDIAQIEVQLQSIRSPAARAISRRPLSRSAFRRRDEARRWMRKWARVTGYYQKITQSPGLTFRGRNDISIAIERRSLLSLSGIAEASCSTSRSHAAAGKPRSSKVARRRAKAAGSGSCSPSTIRAWSRKSQANSESWSEAPTSPTTAASRSISL